MTTEQYLNAFSHGVAATVAVLLFGCWSFWAGMKTARKFRRLGVEPEDVMRPMRPKVVPDNVVQMDSDRQSGR